MPAYLVQVAYSPEGAAALVKNPQNRIQLVSAAVEKIGGRVETGYFCFGQFDALLIAHLPDNISAAAFSMAAAAGGAVSRLVTTPLLTQEEGVEAMRKASQSGYRPPGG
jgi:uncharacterized protein with GYD domain